MFVFFNDTATTEIYTLSLHDALPISAWRTNAACAETATSTSTSSSVGRRPSSGSSTETMPSSSPPEPWSGTSRSEEHTSELQSRQYLVCRLLLEKKTKIPNLTSV